jgi:hypothetical protein
MKKFWLMLIVSVASLCASGQPKRDSVVIKVGEASKVLVVVGSRNDIATMRQYNFQALINDLLNKIEGRDTAVAMPPPATYLQATASATSMEQPLSERDSEPESSRHDEERRKYRYRTYRSFNIDLGTNNYLSDGRFPDPSQLYNVRPWGSWYVGLNSVQRTRISNRVFIEWGLGASWYNFKFQQNNTLVNQDDIGVSFTEDVRDLNFRKSKLTATYINASFVPVFDLGDAPRKTSIFDGSRMDFSHRSGRHSDALRIGAGPYIGYRIASYAKLQYEDNGKKERERNHDNFYLNNLRYGVRFQLGFRDTDLFFNYDLNELFTAGRGPNLNAVSFGVTF